MYRYLITAFSALLLAMPVTAQETTGVLTGRVVDAQGLALPGATVTATGPQGERVAVTDAQGNFRFSFLVPATYDVKVELEGFKTTEQREVVVRLGQTIDLTNVKLEVGTLAETVEVRATSPLIDTSSTTVGAVIDSELMKQIPVGRRMSDTLYIAPGVSDGGGTGSANPSMGGASGLENQYVVDGVNITNAGYGALGSYSIVFGSLGNGVNFDFIKEIQVKTGGYEAEYGQATGGVVNVVTKSGTNALRGSLFSYFSPSGLEGEWTPITTVNGTVNTTKTNQSDIGAEAGGPLLRDRLFFFGAVNPQWQTRTFVAPDGFPLEGLGEVDRDRFITSYSAKATYQAGTNHRLDVTFFGDPAKGDMGPQRSSSLLLDSTSSFSEIKYGGHNQAVRYDGVFGSSWLLEASYSRAQNRIEETPSVDDWRVVDNTGDRQVITGGIGFYEVGNDGVNQQWSVKSTHLLAGHSVKYGVLYEDINYDNIINRTGPPITLRDGTQTVTGANVSVIADPTYGQVYRVTRANTSNVRNTEQQYFSFFAQDNWQVGDRLTINPGIRYEQQKLVGNLADFTWDGNWAARIGGTFDPIGNGRSKIYGNWGRFFAKIPNDLAARALSADAGVTLADYFDAALTQPIADGIEAGNTTNHLITAGTSAADFDPESKSTYMDEFVVGGEYEIMPNVAIGARYIRRTFGRVLEDVGTAPMVAYFLGLDGLDSVEYFITNPGPNTPTVTDISASFEDPIHDYDAVEVTFDKRFADNWQMQASYRWSRLYGTFEGFFRNDNGQSDPAITSLFDFPTNDPSYVDIGVPEFGFRGDIRYLGALGAGPLPNDRPHQFKTFGNYLFDNGLNIGAGFIVGSGRPLTALAANPAYDSDGEIPEGPRGSGIDTIDGFKTRTPVEIDVNVQASYALRLAGERRIVLLANAFNLFDLQRVREYDNFTQTGYLVENPDYGTVYRYQEPFRLQFGARFEF
jgi:outer membrane receptor protein involved in Fe transport